MSVDKECKSNEKSVDLKGTDLTQLTQILDLVTSVFNSVRKPATKIPPALIMIGAKLKPGMSPRNLAADTLTMLESDLGIPMNDDATHGQRNNVAAAFVATSKTTIEHIQDNASVQGAIAPASINVTVTGANAGGPLVAQGTNTTPTGVGATII
jgi:hypothetical protein